LGIFGFISPLTDKNDLKIDAQIEKIKLSRQTTTEKPSFLDSWMEFTKPELYKPFIIMLSFFAIQQFSGIFVIFVYAAQFSIEAGVVMDEFLAAVIIGVVRCVATVLVAFASDKFGKKTLVTGSGVGMFLCMTGLAICAAFPPTDTNFSWLPAMFLFGFIFTGTFGVLTFPFAMVAEMYPQKSRGFAAGITMSLAFLMSFGVIKTFSDAFELFGNVLVFSFYAFVAALGVAFGIFILPETKGKSLQDIENYFKKK
jgi:MFS family permease